MATLTIPCRPSVPHYQAQVALEGRTYTLTFRWNAREEAWFLSIGDAAGNIVLANRKVVLSFPLTSRFRLPGLPPGEFVAVDTTGRGQEAGLSDLGERVQLLYVEAASLPEDFVQ